MNFGVLLKVLTKVTRRPIDEILDYTLGQAWFYLSEIDGPREIRSDADWYDVVNGPDF